MCACLYTSLFLLLYSFTTLSQTALRHCLHSAAGVVAAVAAAAVATHRQGSRRSRMVSASNRSLTAFSSSLSHHVRQRDLP